VVSGGQAFVVEVADTREWEALPVVPVIDLVDIPAISLIVFCDYTNMSAYGPNGFVWRSHRLSYDGLKIERADSQKIVARAWSAPQRQFVPVEVDTRTGAHNGGDAPGEE
jgi:hypothetical protein